MLSLTKCGCDKKLGHLISRVNGRLGCIQELLDQQEEIGLELAALREQATQELEAFPTPKRKRRTKAETAAQE